MAVVSGDKPTATLSVKTDDNYTVHLMTLNIPDSARSFAMSLDGGAAKTVTLGPNGNRVEGTTSPACAPVSIRSRSIFQTADAPTWITCAWSRAIRSGTSWRRSPF